jgi:nitrogen fixation protein FixH
MSSPQSGRVLTGRHVLLCFLAFFGVIFAVNGYFLSVALSTHTGVVSVEPYRKGLKYNDRIAAAERQHALGWQDEISIAADGLRLTLVMRDRDGQPVRNLQVTGALGRPVTTREDVGLALVETEPGRYESALPAEEHGAYIATLEARGADGTPDVLYRTRKRLWVEQ